MNVKVDLSYTMQITARQFNLIGLALVGRLEPDDLEEAGELNRAMLHMRLKAHEQHVKNTARAIESLGPDPAQQVPAKPLIVQKSGHNPSGTRTPSPSGTAVVHRRIG